MKKTWQATITVALILTAQPGFGTESTVRSSKSSAPAGVLPEMPADLEVTTLNSVESESEGALTIITAKLNLKPKWRKLDTEDHGSFVQIILPGTVIPKPGTFYNGSGPYIKKVAAYQLTPSDGAIRLFTSKEAAKVRAATTAEVLGDRVIITLDHKKLESILPPEEAAPIVASKKASHSNIDPDMLPAFDKIAVPTADHIVANTPVRTDIPSPAEQIKAETAGEILSPVKRETEEKPIAVATVEKSPTVDNPAAPLNATAQSEQMVKPLTAIGVGKNVPDLSNKLSGVAIFSAIMLILMGGLYLLKPILRRRAAAGNDGDIIKMRTIATMPLAAKQRLALVQVGNEQILLAISPDNVNFITTISRGTEQQARLPVSGSMSAPMPGLAAMGNLAAPQRRIAAPNSNPIDQFTMQLLNPENDAVMSMRKPQSSNRATLPAQSGRPTNKVVTRNQTETRPSEAAPRTQSRKSINIAIGDDGIKRVGASQSETNSRSAKPTRSSGTASEKPLDDITRLIREKLKNLPAI